jgi:hypothetical protein
VVEVDGERVSVYRVDEEALRARLGSGASQAGAAESSL